MSNNHQVLKTQNKGGEFFSWVGSLIGVALSNENSMKPAEAAKVGKVRKSKKSRYLQRKKKTSINLSWEVLHSKGTRSPLPNRYPVDKSRLRRSNAKIPTKRPYNKVWNPREGKRAPRN